MTKTRNSAIRDYLSQTFVNEDEGLVAAKQRAEKEGLPNISISPHVGKLLSFLTRLQNPKRILELGTLAGYSTLWLAKGAPDAKIITIENNPKHAKVARANFQTSTNIELIEGDALEIIKQFVKEKVDPFDLIFLDAYKEGYPLYLPYLLELSRPGTMLVTDNLIPKEEKINEPDPRNMIATRTYEYNLLLAKHSKLDTIPVTTIVGEEGRVDALGVTIVSA